MEGKKSMTLIDHIALSYDSIMLIFSASLLPSIPLYQSPSLHPSKNLIHSAMHRDNLNPTAQN